jgi:antitoxin component of MazEF toxin-antitoxin module
MLEDKKIPETGIKTTVRKVQAYHGERSITVVLPKDFAASLEIEKGDFLKVSLEGNKLVLQKADI